MKRDVRNLLREAKRAGARIIRQTSDDPRLFLFGESHIPIFNYYDPRGIFIALQPHTFFPEIVYEGNTLSAEHAQTKFWRDLSSVGGSPEGSFESKCGRCPSFGAQAVRVWSAASPKTLYVGMDMDGTESKWNQHGAAGKVVLENLVARLKKAPRENDEVRAALEIAEACSNHSDHNKSSFDPYLACDRFSLLIERAPEALSLVGMDQKSADFIERMVRYNTDRETTMGRTMVEHVRGKDGYAMASLGDMHSREGSHVFPVLDDASIPYIAVSLSVRDEIPCAWEFDHESKGKTGNNEDLINHCPYK